MKGTFNIFMAGVGGQGIGLLAELMARAADYAGWKVRACDTHGLAQRGGMVTSHLRLGDSNSPLVPDGRADLVTGKRYHAHNGHDPGGNDARCVYYYSLDVASRTWTRHLMHEGGTVGFGINTQAVDIDGDGDLDVVAPGKSGLYLFENLLK